MVQGSRVANLNKIYHISIMRGKNNTITSRKGMLILPSSSSEFFSSPSESEDKTSRILFLFLEFLLLAEEDSA